MEGARTATADDVPTLARLAREAVVELTPTRGGSVWSRREARPEPLEASFEAALELPEHVVLVGTIDGAPVGYAVAHVEVLRDEGRLAIVDDIYVEPEARGVSVGEAMMDRVIEWARGRRCLGVDSFVLPGHREAKNFFERFGLTARAIRVHKSLEGRPSGPPKRPGGAVPS